MPQTSFGQRVRVLRRAQGVSQQALATLCGVDSPTIARIEAGDEPGAVTIAELMDIASALGVKATALLGLDEP